MAAVTDPDELVVVVKCSGRYSPDVVDDVSRRCLDLYQRVLAFRSSVEVVLEEIDLPGGDAEQ